MKKFIYTFVVLFACALTVSAQKAFTGRSVYSVPACLTYDHKPCLSVFGSEGMKPVTITDMTFNTIASIGVGGSDYITGLYLEYIDGNGIKHDSRRIYATQTLFNDDADWEYVETEYLDNGTVYTIKKVNGTIVGTFSGEKWSPNSEEALFIIGDDVYVGRSNWQENKLYLYTPTEFRRYLFGTADGVQAVPAFTRTISKEAYDLAGRKASDNQRGIVVKDGKKMLVK